MPSCKDLKSDVQIVTKKNPRALGAAVDDLNEVETVGVVVESRSARITCRAEAKLKNGRFVWIRDWAKVDQRYDKGERLVTVTRE